MFPPLSAAAGSAPARRRYSTIFVRPVREANMRDVCPFSLAALTSAPAFTRARAILSQLLLAAVLRGDGIEISALLRHAYHAGTAMETLAICRGAAISPILAWPLVAPGRNHDLPRHSMACLPSQGEATAVWLEGTRIPKAAGSVASQQESEKPSRFSGSTRPRHSARPPSRP